MQRLEFRGAWCDVTVMTKEHTPWPHGGQGRAASGLRPLAHPRAVALLDSACGGQAAWLQPRAASSSTSRGVTGSCLGDRLGSRFWASSWLCGVSVNTDRSGPTAARAPVPRRYTGPAGTTWLQVLLPGPGCTAHWVPGSPPEVAHGPSSHFPRAQAATCAPLPRGKSNPAPCPQGRAGNIGSAWEVFVLVWV